jgi:hypothetical protein
LLGRQRPIPERDLWNLVHPKGNSSDRLPEPSTYRNRDAYTREQAPDSFKFLT